MPDSTAKVRRDQGADKLTVDDGGSIDILDGGKITADGAQAAAIADISETAGTMTVGERQSFNAVLAALRGAGIIASA